MNHMANSTADGSVVIDVNMDVSQANKQLAKLKSNIEKSEREISDTQKKLDEAQKKSLIDAGELDAEKAKLSEMRKELEEIKRISTDKTVSFSVRDEAKAQIPDTRAAIQEQQQRVNMLQAEWNKTENSVDRYSKKIEDATEKLAQQQTEAGVLTERIIKAENAQSSMGKAHKRATKSASIFENRLKGILASAFVFNILSAGLRQFTSWLGKAVKSNDQASAAIARLKGALLTLAQPIVQVIIPAFTALVNAITTVVSAIASVVSFIFGTTADKSAEAAESLYDEQKALGGVGAAAKKAGKQLANFDEINKISSEDSGGGGSGGGGIGNIEPDFSFIQDGIDGILSLITGVALLAVGAILTFSGANVPVGVALMALGAIAIYSAFAGDPALVAALVQSGLATVFEIIGPLIAVVGVILLMTGHILPGIALILLGIGIWATGSAAGEGGDFSQVIQQKLLEAVGVIAPLLAVIGILLLVTGHLALGLGLLIAGIALWAVKEEAGDDGKSIQEKIVSVLTKIATVIAPVLGVIGIVLMVTGHLLLGLGFLIAGIALFNIAEEAGDDGKTVQEKIQNVLTNTAKVIAPVLGIIGVILLVTGNLLLGLGFLLAGIAIFNIAEQAGDDGKSMEEKITGIMTGIAQGITVLGAALLVLGIILLFTGVAAPLGLGMLVAGAGMLIAGAIVPNWSFIKDAISKAYEDMVTWWDNNAAQFFTLEYWANLAADMLNGLFGGLADLGRRIADWGSGFINGVKDFFGIHSPSTEFEGLGEYMMLGLQNGVTGGTDPVVYAFSVLFTAVSALCTQNMDLMQLSINALLIYFMTQFIVDWEKGWFSAYQSSNANINLIIAGLDTMTNAMASSVIRMISYLNQLEAKLRAVLALMAAVGAGGGGGISGYSAGMSTRMAAIPVIAQADIPHLARGAVIPPNREFMAVLGDQKSGTNVEAPVSEIEQAVARGIRAAGAIGSSRPITVIMQLDRREFGRVVYEVNNEETQIVGVNFAEVVRA